MAGVRIYDVSEPEGAEARQERADLQRLAHAHDHPEPDGQGRHLHLRVGQPGRAAGDGARRVQERHRSGRRDELAVPARRDQGAARASGEGRGRDGRAHLHGPDAGAACARRARGRGGGGRGGRGGRGGDCRRDTRRRPAADRSAQLPRRDGVSGDAPARRRVRAATACSSTSRIRKSRCASTRMADTNFSLWHTAVFSNDGKKVVFTDEWGGGTAPMCQATSMMEMGGNTILTISADKKYTQHAYFKIPTAQTRAGELRVAQRRAHSGAGARPHGAGLVSGRRRRDATSPIPIIRSRSRTSTAARSIRRRGVDVPVAPPRGRARRGGSRGTIGGSWGAYYWNGYDLLVRARRAASTSSSCSRATSSRRTRSRRRSWCRFTEYNPQSQPKIVWPAAFPVVRSYLDQLVRNNGLAAERTTAIAKALDAAEKQTGAARGASLTKLAKQVDDDVSGAKDRRA